MSSVYNVLYHQEIDGVLPIRKGGVFGLRDTRKDNSGRKSEKELTLEEKYARLEAERNLLKS